MAKRSTPGPPRVGQRGYLGADIRRVAEEDELGRTAVTVHLLIGGYPLRSTGVSLIGKAILVTEG